MRITIFIIVVIVLNINFCFSQKSIDTIPFSFIYSSEKNPISNQKDIHEYIMPSFNIDSIDSIENELNNKGIGRPYRFGYGFHVKYNLLNSGTWDTLENGSRLWRLRIICPKAYSINLIYSKFEISEKSLFFLYDVNHTYVLGAFTFLNNKSHKKFATDLVIGNSIILELYEPKEVIGKSEIEISKIVHGYKNLSEYERKMIEETKKDQIQETDCDDEVNCPEGDSWCREKYSVSRVIVEGEWWCSGSLLNNVRNDYTPYYLTAFHWVMSIYLCKK